MAESAMEVSYVMQLSQALLEAGDTIQESTQARHRYLAVQKDHEEAKETQGESKRRATGTTRARAAAPAAFFLRLPYGQYGPVSQLSRSEESCTGPFNWGEAHCAGEQVKRKIGPFLWKSLKNQTKTRTQQKGAQPATATRNPPARLPGARAKEENNHNKQETSQANLGTP